ncbi:MAG: hypothetical protein LBF68_04950 [Christensenellaceae bacterium]|jgi:hypothetical protein|nr:hypothetical protein [Christensenellaceae bacterium]
MIEQFIGKTIEIIRNYVILYKTDRFKNIDYRHKERYKQSIKDNALLMRSYEVGIRKKFNVSVYSHKLIVRALLKNMLQLEIAHHKSNGECESIIHMKPKLIFEYSKALQKVALTGMDMLDNAINESQINTLNKKGEIRMPNQTTEMNDVSGESNITIAVDFDGTLCSNAYPDIGDPIENVIKFIKTRKADGACIILWTCRCGELLKSAIEWCEKQGITFDYINTNTKENVALFGNDPRKIFADLYIDDKAITSLIIDAMYKGNGPRESQIVGNVEDIFPL